MRNDTLNALIMRHGDRLLHQAGCRALPSLHVRGMTELQFQGV